MQALANTVQALRQSKQEEQQTSVQVQETLKRTASVASELEMRIGKQSVMQEQLRMTAKRAQQIGEQALQETRQLQVTQQSAATELKRLVVEIGLKIQEQADKTLLQEQTVKAEQEKAKAQLWHCLGCIGVWFGDWFGQTPSLCDILCGNGAPPNVL